MSRTTIKAEIDANIKQNGNQEITGLILNSVLNQINDGHTTKVRVDITGTTGSYQFKIGNQVLNFQELNNLLQVSPDFLVFVHGKREHRCTFIDLDSNPKQMRFVAPLLNEDTLKTQSFYVTSNDGVAITSIVSSNINCENSSNKRSDLSNPNNTTYPTTKAVQDAFIVRDTKLSELETELNNTKKDIYGISYDDGEFIPGMWTANGYRTDGNYGKIRSAKDFFPLGDFALSIDTADLSNLVLRLSIFDADNNLLSTFFGGWRFSTNTISVSSIKEDVLAGYPNAVYFVPYLSKVSGSTYYDIVGNLSLTLYGERILDRISHLEDSNEDSKEKLTELEHDVNKLVGISKDLSYTTLIGQAINQQNGRIVNQEGWTTIKAEIDNGSKLKALVNGEQSTNIRYCLYNAEPTIGQDELYFIEGGLHMPNPFSVPTEQNRYWIILSYQVEGVVFSIHEDAVGDFEKLENIVGRLDRKILWLGTSIPEGCPYPQNACKALGYECYNMSLGSSGIILNEGFLNNGRDGKDLAESASEKEQRYRPYVTSGAITEAKLNAFKTYGYDARIIPYIDGTIANCDMVVFDHGFNDRQNIEDELASLESANFDTDRADNEFIRSSFVGAFCFLVKKIWEVNPNIKIVICSYLENISGRYMSQGFHSGKAIDTMLGTLAEKFNFPYLKTYLYNGFNYGRIPNSEGYIQSFNETYGTSYSLIRYYNYQGDNITKFQYYCPDGIHPHTDLTGRSEKILTQSVIKCIKDI